MILEYTRNVVIKSGWKIPELSMEALMATSPLNESMDSFKGHVTGLSPLFHGQIDGFRLRFSSTPCLITRGYGK
jgi:hypothetical protein